MTKQTIRIMLLGAAISAVSLSGLTRPADAQTVPPATQPAGRGGRGNLNPADELKNYRDRFEGLNLTDDQMKKIDGFLDTATTEVTKAGEDRRTAYQAMRKLREDVQSILTDTQKAAMRAKETARMFDGLKTRYTAPELKLTDDQTAKINAIIAEAKTAATTAAAAPTPDTQQGGRQRFAGFRETLDKLNAVLTPDQQKLMPQRGPGGPGGPGGGGRSNRGTGGTPPTPPPAQ